jgi:hypothetical protein
MNECGHGYGYGCLFELVNGHWRIQFGGGGLGFLDCDILESFDGLVGQLVVGCLVSWL